MKYIKQYEMRYDTNKKNVDYNKVYTFGNDVGKLMTNTGKGIRDVGCIFIGYNKDDQEVAHIIKYSAWKFVREATTKDIDRYNILSQASKYNL